MCQDVQTINGQDVSCRKCDECLQTRRNTWTARAMAESSVSNYCFAVNLTYNNETQQNREASQVFRYSHIVDFHKKLRISIKRQFGPDAYFRFIVAGEIGSKGTKRVHWHCIYFSNVDITAVGKIRLFHAPHTMVNDPENGQGITEDFDTRVSWNLWGHGLLYFQRPDQKGMAYCVKYAMKEEFAALNAEGSKRYTKSDNYASGMFRMSKRPPLGRPFLEKRLATLLASGSVDTTLSISIPGYSGYWYLGGEIRRWYLTRLKFINEERKIWTGKNAPQWASLIAELSLNNNPKDMEVINGQETQEIETREEFEESLASTQREATVRHNNRQIRKRCGGLRPCESCANSLAPHQRDKADRWRTEWLAHLDRFKGEDGKRASQELAYRATIRQCNPWCQLHDLPETLAAFSKTGI